MFNTGLIDSLRVRVKMDKVKIIDKRVIDKWLVYYPDADQLDDDLRNAEPYTKILQGITYRFFPKAYIDGKKYAQEYMVFQISAKMLKHRYFEGITMDNVDEIVKGLNQWGAIKITREALLDGLVADIDICINQLIDYKSLEVAFGLIRQFPMASKKPLIHFISKVAVTKPKNDPDSEIWIEPKKVKNFGIDFNKREKATNSTPYCKIYHKGWELQTKSSDFLYYHLSNFNKNSLLDNLVRYEFTIKNAKHKSYLCDKGYNADFKTLKDLLKASPDDLRAIAMSGLPHYLEPRTRSSVSDELSPMDMMIQYYQETIIKLGGDEEKLLGFSYLIDCPVSRSRTKSKAKKLIDDLKNRDANLKKKLHDNERATNFLTNIGFQIP